MVTIFRTIEKFERYLSKIRPESTFHRLFRSNTGFQPSIVGSERANQEDFYINSQKDITNAVLGAEQVIMATTLLEQRRRFL